MKKWIPLYTSLLVIGLCCVGCQDSSSGAMADSVKSAVAPVTALPAGTDKPVATSEIVTRVIEYSVDGQPYTGYLAYDSSIAGKRPGVLVVHEWWGHNNYARSRAEQLAKMGYTAFALDMYGSGKVADHPDNAMAFMQAAMQDPQAIKGRFIAAKQLLMSQATTDPEHIAAIGYCFGGGVVLNMARAGVDLDGVASFHGSLAASPGT